MEIVESVKPEIQITRENLRRVCGLNGFTIAELAAKIGVGRQTVYDCITFPTRWPKAHAKVNAALPIRKLPHE